MRIGVGITSYNRPQHLALCEKQLAKHGTRDLNVFIYADNDRKGIAYAKNSCIYALRDCDYIFLLDDDCIVIADQWWEYFIDSGFNHSLYMNATYNPILKFPKHTAYRDASGVFMFMTKEVIKKVGYYNSAYGIYGLEHAGYSQRIYLAGLTPCFYPVLNDTHKYIYSLDHQGVGDWGIEHYPSLSKEEREESVKKNDVIYHQECQSSKIYYGFKP